MALIELSRATDLLPNFDPANNAVMQAIVDACSAVVERYCNRTFAATAYDELYDGTGDLNLLLDNYPVISIDRVMYNLINVFQVRMTDLDASRAQFALSDTALTLTRVKNGVTLAHSLTLTDYLTLADLQTAVNAFSAEGWAALALGVYSSFPVADLKAPQGGYDCRWQGAGYLKLHAYSLPGFDVNPAVGEIVSPFGFGRAYRGYRVVYTAGYSAIPDDVQQATAELASLVFQTRTTNPNVQSESLGQYSYTNAVEKSFAMLSPAAQRTLGMYKNYRVPKFKVV